MREEVDSCLWAESTVGKGKSGSSPPPKSWTVWSEACSTPAEAYPASAFHLFSGHNSHPALSAYGASEVFSKLANTEFPLTSEIT